MLNSLKKPATSTPAKKTLTAAERAERAEAVAAAVAAAQAAQAAKKAGKSPAAGAGAGAAAANAAASGSKPNGKDTKDSKDNKDKDKDGNKENGEEGENGAGGDDKDEEEEEKETEKGQSAEAKAAMKNMSGYQQDVEREGVDSAKLEKAMGLITDVMKKQKAEKATTAHKDGEKLTLSKEDVELVMTEMELSKPLAEKYLKEHGGDVTRTLEALVSA